MSKISFTPNASGTGTFTIASPDSNTNRTLTLPDADGALLAGAQAAFIPATVSGATQALDVSAANFFDAGTLTADTTVSFSSVPTEASWTYTAEVGIVSSYDLSIASYTGNNMATTVQTTPRTFYLSPNGLNSYVVGNGLVAQYDLSVAGDMSTGVYSSKNLNHSSQTGASDGMFFKPDGTKLYITGGGSYFGYPDNVFQYTLSTAWDISTASYDSVSFNPSSQTTWPRGLFFKPDGTKMYIASDYSENRVYEYGLSTAWSVSTASYNAQSPVLSSQDGTVTGCSFSDDGTKMFMVGTANDQVHQYALSTAWDVSTASYSSSFSVASQDLEPSDVFFGADGTKMYITGDQYNTILEYDTASLTSITVPASVQNPPTQNFGVQRIAYTFYTLDGGTNVYLINEEVL